MKKIFRFLLVAPVIAGLIFSGGCKKSPPPSIIGTWQFGNVVANGQSSVTANSSTTTTSSSISYVPSVTTITQTTVSTGQAGSSVVLNGYTLQITINADGSYLVDESYTYGGVATSTTTTGTWIYYSNSSSNDNIDFGNGGSILLNGGTLTGNVAFGIDRRTFNINSLSSTQLILNGNNSSTSSTSTGATSQTTSATVTFTRVS